MLLLEEDSQNVFILSEKAVVGALKPFNFFLLACKVNAFL